tara:strand:- start:391 stop:1074 length:684 start_codon:yes stop_codon:yes gene_type:complete
MNNEKYLIFAEKLTTEDVDNSDKTVQTTTALADPVSLFNATSGTDGIIEVQLKAHADHTFGSAYGSPTDGDYVTINSSGFTVGASDGVVTILTTTEDSVNGVDVSSTANNNDFRFNLLQHIDGGTLCAFPASKFTGVQLIDDTNTEAYFEAGTGDLDAVDVVRFTHGAGKFKECVEMLNDAMSSSKTGASIDFFIGGSSGATGTTIDNVVFNNNPASITAVDIQLDA